jgi:hypothetical protein
MPSVLNAVAFANIKKAAEYYDVDIKEERWQELGKHPHTRNPVQSFLRPGRKL